MFKTSLQTLWTAVVGFFLLVSSLPAFSQGPARTLIEDHLVTAYKGKQLMVQGCYCGNELKFDSKGVLVDGGQPGSWTICRDVRIDDVQISNDKLQVTGKRVYLFYDSEKKAFRDVDEIQDHASKAYKKLIETQQVKIEVSLSSRADQSGADAALNEIFWPGDFKFSQAAPEIWKSFFPGESDPSSSKKCVGPPPSAPNTKKAIQVIKNEEPGSNSRDYGGATPPKLIYAPDPEFTDWARKASYQGVAVLKVVVGTDGRVHSIQITRPLGMGLDEKAVDAIKLWRFEPAHKRDGTPVDVYAAIEVNFRLY
jgi:TonB family protein